MLGYGHDHAMIFFDPEHRVNKEGNTYPTVSLGNIIKINLKVAQNQKLHYMSCIPEAVL